MNHPMDHALVYRLWQATHAERKIAPFLARVANNPPKRVLDVGCGPGTNARHFRDCDYLGVDINPSYVSNATRRYGHRFRVADVTRNDLDDGGTYDCILVNSLLHHLSDVDADRLLSRLPALLSADGVVHIIDIVMPGRRFIARKLARLDRGKFVRSSERCRELMTRHFTLCSLEEYGLRNMGVTFWQVLYFTGARP